MNDVKNLRETLKIIEGLCCFFDESDKSLKTARYIIDDIYTIAHLHSDCNNLHMDWRKKRHKWKEDLKKAGII